MSSQQQQETTAQRQQRYRQLIDSSSTLSQLRELIHQGEDIQEIFRCTAHKLISSVKGRELFRYMVTNCDIDLEVRNNN